MTSGATHSQIARIPGSFWPVDEEIFRRLLDGNLGDHGDLAELGVYLGKSAVLIGSYRRSGETFTVVDLFGTAAPDSTNSLENAQQYPDLTQEKFEMNYSGVHGDLPVIVQGPSDSIVNHASLGTHRFVHIDASHLYDHVVKDIEAARRLLGPNGVVAFDDYRSPHTPGVAAAVWGAVAEGMHPFALSDMKMYATWGDPEPHFRKLKDWVVESAQLLYEEQVVADRPVLRVWSGRGWTRWVPPALVPQAASIGRVARRLARSRAR